MKDVKIELVMREAYLRAHLETKFLHECACRNRGMSQPEIVADFEERTRKILTEILKLRRKL